MVNKTIVMIIGAPRSGTTLVSGLLSAGNEPLPMLPECSYVTQIVQNYFNFLHYSDPQRFAAYAIDEPTLTNMYRKMVDAMLETVQSHFSEIDYRYLILKDPELTPLVDLIPIFFGEDSKTVCVVRDPRAVLASMFEVERKKKQRLWATWRKSPNWGTTSHLANHLFRERTLIHDFFVYYWRVQESQLYKNGFVHIVHYEKIISQDEEEFKRLENFLGFDIGRKGFGNAPFGFDKSDPTYSAGYGQSIQTPTSDFTKKLSWLQLRKIKCVFNGMNKIYGWW